MTSHSLARRRPRRPASRLALAAVAVAAVAAAAAAADTLAPHDVVSVYIEDERSLDRPVEIDASGAVPVAYLGLHPVDGLDPAAAAERLSAAIDDAGFLVAPRVTVVIESRAPYFIDGAVARPGAYPFLPGLTVDRAVAIAGGYETLAARERAIDPLRIGELRGRLEAATLRRAELEVGLARLDALEADEPFAGGGEADGTMAAIRANETSLLEAARSARDAEQSAGAKRLTIVAEELAILEKRRGELELLVVELTRQQDEVDDLVRRGISTQQRLNTSNAEMLRARADLLATDQAIARAKREQHDLRATLAESLIDFDAGIAEERRRILDAIAEEEETIAVVDAQLGLFGLGLGPRENGFEVTIRRGDGDARETLTATPDAPLRRGDVIRVSPAAGPRDRDGAQAGR